MFKGLFPREGRFFDLFKASADQIVLSTEALKVMVGDLAHSHDHAKKIRDIEHKADTITHQTMELLHKTFITPLDRQDIHELISRMDDIVDYIEAVSERLSLYDFKSAPKAVGDLANICYQSAHLLRKAIGSLENLKNSQELLKICIEINHFENQADQILRNEMAKLFREETDTRQLIKLKEVYEMLEAVTDRCEDVANIIEGIVLEYA